MTVSSQEQLATRSDMFFNKQLVAIPVVGLLIICFLRYLYLRFFTRGTVPDNFPWVGVNGDGFSRSKATWLSITKTRELLEEGYYKVVILPLHPTATC
jgi:hypothetical protein